MASSSVEDYVRRAEKAEEEIQVLLNELKNLEKCPTGGNPGNNGDESAIPNFFHSGRLSVQRCHGNFWHSQGTCWNMLSILLMTRIIRIFNRS